MWLVKVEYVIELLYWISLDFTGIDSKAPGECIFTKTMVYIISCFYHLPWKQKLGGPSKDLAVSFYWCESRKNNKI